MESVWPRMAEFHRRNQNSMNRSCNINNVTIESLKLCIFSFFRRKNLLSTFIININVDINIINIKNINYY